MYCLVLGWLAALCFSSGAAHAQEFQPHQMKSVSAEYDLGGVEVRPGEAVYLAVPKELQGSPLDFASIGHRQDPRAERECRSDRPDWDCLPAYTSLEFMNENGEWRCWGGPGSGPCNSKFAEVRGGAPGETDNLYEWRHYGHIRAVARWDEANGPVSHDPLYVKGIRIRALGRDSLLVHRVIIKVLPPAPIAIRDFIFARGFRFGDFQTAEARRYPGHPWRGDYGDALQINRNFIMRHSQWPEGWRSGPGRISIPLEAGRELVAVDIAVGDMRPVPAGVDPLNYRGGAVVNLELLREGSSIDRLMNRENVGESGVLRASPSEVGLTLRGGDVLQLTVPTSDTANIMGIRVSYK